MMTGEGEGKGKGIVLGEFKSCHGAGYLKSYYYPTLWEYLTPHMLFPGNLEPL
jgi:hypothetical protein